MKISLTNDQNKIKMDLGLIKKTVDYIADKFDRDPKSELSIVFIDSKKIRELNKKYRNTDKVTDVLSFSYISDREKINPGAGDFTVGEIIICPEVALSGIPGGDKNWSFDLEMIFLVIHGILHIYDYDHREEKDKMDMERIQDSLISDVRRTFNL
jgi:probable rRNA maturation factor